MLIKSRNRRGKATEEEFIIEGVDSDEAYRIQDVMNRKLYINEEISVESVEWIIRHILDYNASDRKIAPKSRKPVYLYIMSGGGDMEAGLTLINVILNSKTPVYTVNLGYQYSMAFYIGLAGHKRYAVKEAKYLIHDGSIFLCASGTKAQDQLEFQRRVESKLRDYVISRSKMTPEEYDEKARIEWYLFADEAKEKGFIDYIVGEDCDINSII